MTKFSIGWAWREQRRVPPPVSVFFKTSLAGRVVIVTGSNVGLGFEAAKHFASLRPEKLILAVRTPSKGEAAKQATIEDTGIAPEAVEVWKLDLCSFESVRSFAERAKTLPRLDVVLENAGMVNRNWTVTSDGYESGLQANVISTGLLGALLLPLLERTANLPALDSSPNFKPHLTIVSSEMHFVVKFPEQSEDKPIAALNDKGRFNANDRYPVTKLLDLFTARELGKIASNSVVVNSCTPGFCQSDLDKEGSFIERTIMAFMRATLGRTTEVGSRPLVWAATQDTPNGAYTSNCEVQEESDFAISDAGQQLCNKIWAELKDIWKEVAPESREVFQ